MGITNHSGITLLSDGLPPGGTNGQILTKVGSIDFESSWQSAAPGGVTSVNGETGAITFTSSGGSVTITTPTSTTVNLEAVSGGSGTVTQVSVVSTNGFAGTVANDTSTPAITLSTSITGVLKGNGTAISAAVASTDYSLGTSGLATGILKSTTTTGALTIAIAADFPTLNQNTTGNASTVTNATLTTALTVNGGTLTLTANAANTSVLTIGAGAVSVSGANTGDQTITLTGAVTGSGTGSFATTIATPGTLTVASTNSTATAHTHAITSSSAPGAAASILATDSSGIIGSTGTRIVKIWATDLTVTNAIAASITGSAPTLTTPRAIYGNNFDGSAALTQIIASTYGGTGNGFAKLSGPATSEKTFTLPNASAAILTDNAAVTVAQGGTGLGTLTTGNVILGAGTSNVTFVAPSTSGNVLTSNGTTWTSAAPAAGGTTININTKKVDQTPASGTYGTLAGTVNGSNALFTVSNSAYVSGTLVVYLNGQEQTQGASYDWVETTPSSGTFTFNTAPPTGSVVTAEYISSATTSGGGIYPSAISGYLPSSIAGTSTTAAMTIAGGITTDSTNVTYLQIAGNTSWAASNGNAINGTDAASSTLANSATYHMFACNGGSGTGTFASASLTPTFPTGYTAYSKRIFSFKTSAAGAPLPGTAVEVEGGAMLFYLTTQLQDINVATLPSANRTLYTTACPTGIKVWPMNRYTTGETTIAVLITSPDETDVACGTNLATTPAYDLFGGAGGSGSMQFFNTTNTSAQIGARGHTSSNKLFATYLRGWKDFRR